MARETFGSGAVFGDGVVLDPATNRFIMLFEGPLDENPETGEKCRAGLKLAMTGKKGTTLPSLKACEYTASRFAREGIQVLGIEPGALQPITWEKFQEKGYDGDE